MLNSLKYLEIWFSHQIHCNTIGVLSKVLNLVKFEAFIKLCCYFLFHVYMLIFFTSTPPKLGVKVVNENLKYLQINLSATSPSLIIKKST